MHRPPQNIAQKLKQRADARNVIDLVAQELAFTVTVQLGNKSELDRTGTRKLVRDRVIMTGLRVLATEGELNVKRTSEIMIRAGQMKSAWNTTKLSTISWVFRIFLPAVLWPDGTHRCCHSTQFLHWQPAPIRCRGQDWRAPSEKKHERRLRLERNNKGTEPVVMS